MAKEKNQDQTIINKSIFRNKIKAKFKCIICKIITWMMK